MSTTLLIYRLSRAIDAEERLFRRCERLECVLDGKPEISFFDSSFITPSGVRLEWDRILEEVDDE